MMFILRFLSTYMETAASETDTGGGDVAAAVTTTSDGDGQDAGGTGDTGGDHGAGNWRDPFSAGDADAAKRFERYATQADMGKAMIEAQNTIRAGNVLKPLADDATEDDVAAWRKDNGIPGDAMEYFKAVPEGVPVSDEDKVLYEGLAGVLHDNNVKPKVFGDILKWAGEYEAGIEEQQGADDLAAKQSLEDELRTDWGSSDYRANINLVGALAASHLGQEAAELLLGARAADGTALFNNRNVMEMFVKLAREQNPSGVILSGDGNDPLTAVGDRLAEIRKMMRDDRKGYNENDAVQKEYRTLLTAEAKHKEATQKTA